MITINQVFWEHKKRYGVRRISKELARRGVQCGEWRTRRLMENLGLKAIQPKSFTPHTTNSRHSLGYSPNLIQDMSEPKRLNQLWVGDITYLPLTTGRFVFAACLMDRCSRRIIAWDVRGNMKEELILYTLESALKCRNVASGIIHHSDRGGQYAGTKYRDLLKKCRVTQSMSRAGNCYDNAFMESCFGTIKTELENACFASLEVAKKELGQYIRYYNVQRLHSSIGYIPPLEFEENLA